MLLSPMYNAMFWSVVYSTPGEWQRIKNWASNEPARSEALAEFREREARRQQAAANAATTQGAVAKWNNST